MYNLSHHLHSHYPMSGLKISFLSVFTIVYTLRSIYAEIYILKNRNTVAMAFKCSFWQFIVTRHHLLFMFTVIRLNCCCFFCSISAAKNMIFRVNMCCVCCMGVVTKQVEYHWANKMFNGIFEGGNEHVKSHSIK